jgi:hypothetical protein
MDLTHIEQLEGGLYSTKARFRKLLRYSDATTIQSLNKRDEFSEGVYLNERFLISLQEVQVDTHTGICHFQRRIVHESSLWGAHYLLLTVIPRPILSKTLHFPKDVMPVLLPSIGYFHWLTEEIGPFLFALRNTPNPIVLYWEGAPNYVQDFLSKLPYKSLAVPRFVKLKEINFVTKQNQIGWSHKRDLEEVIEYFKPHISTAVSRKRLYISRIKSTRSAKFERSLIKNLEEKDWVVVTLEEMTLQEQVELISSAEIICGISGAGLANAIWLSEKSRVIEIAPDRFSSSITKVCENLNIRHDIIFYENECATHETIVSVIEELINE